MKRFRILSPQKVVLVVVLMFSLVSSPAYAKSPVKLRKLSGQVDFSVPGPQPFVLEGIASHLGKFTAYGEADFVPGEEEGTLLGDGIVVFEAANGDLLVGVTMWQLHADGIGHIHFSWRDSVQFSDGTTVSNTGRFVDDRPPGALVAVETLNLLSLLVISILFPGSFRR
jgi:hypothetical protein